MKSEDLLAAVFPDQVACAENLVGEREMPDHPLVAQTLRDCLHEAMDADGLAGAAAPASSRGAVEVVARDLPAPSPLAAEALNARPYAFLDDAPLEERRTQAVQNRRYGDPRQRRRPRPARRRRDRRACARKPGRAPRNADEMHEALDRARRDHRRRGAREGAAGRRGSTQLAGGGRRDARSRAAAGAASGSPPSGWRALRDAASAAPTLQPPIDAPAEFAARIDDAATRRCASCCARASAASARRRSTRSPRRCGLPRGDVEAALLALQAEGYVLQGRFTPRRCADADEWCERHLLARIHRYTLEAPAPRDRAGRAARLRALPVRVAARRAGAAASAGPTRWPACSAQLEGYEAPAAAWEAELLPARVQRLRDRRGSTTCAPPAARCGRGCGRWPAARRRGGARVAARDADPAAAAPRSAAVDARCAPAPPATTPCSARARARVADFLAAHGASFFDEIADGARLLRAELEDALAELVVRGRVNCDSYAGLRALLVPPSKRASAAARAARARRRAVRHRGRRALVADPAPARPCARGATARSRARPHDGDVEHVARTLLRRYGVVCWRLLEREAAWLPPWRELVRVYRRLEARGEIRGGRFIAGLSGEQFALPEAIAPLREVRRQPPDDALVCLAAADPANLLGTVLPGAKVPRVAGSRVSLSRRRADRHERRRRDRAAGAAGCRPGAGGHARAGAGSAGALHRAGRRGGAGRNLSATSDSTRAPLGFQPNGARGMSRRMNCRGRATSSLRRERGRFGGVPDSASTETWAK